MDGTLCHKCKKTNVGVDQNGFLVEHLRSSNGKRCLGSGQHIDVNIKMIVEDRVKAMAETGVDPAAAMMVEKEIVQQPPYIPDFPVDFSGALALIKREFNMTRKAWRGRRYIYLASGDVYGSLNVGDFLMVRYASDSREPWTPTHADLLAEDWDVA